MKLLQRGIFKRGVCILTRNDINFNTIDLNKFCTNKMFEIRATKHQKNKKWCMLHIQKLPVVLGLRPDHRYARGVRQANYAWMN